jgi:hypothetical protein
MTTPRVPPAGKVGLSKWLTGHKWEAGLGAGGIGVTVFLAYRARKQAAANGTTTASTTTPSSTELPVSYTGGSGSDELGELIPLLQQELNGAGQSNGTTTDAQGNSYVAAGNTSYAQLSAAGEANETYFSPSPGVFLPVTYQVASQGLAKGDPAYIGKDWNPSGS